MITKAKQKKEKKRTSYRRLPQNIHFQAHTILTPLCV